MPAARYSWDGLYKKENSAGRPFLIVYTESGCFLQQQLPVFHFNSNLLEIHWVFTAHSYYEFRAVAYCLFGFQVKYGK
jgi:hypothetical protein